MIGRVARQQANPVATALETLDGDVAVQARHHNLPVQGFGTAAHAHQVAIENAIFNHRIALHPQQVIGGFGESGGVQLQAAVHLGIGANRPTGRHTTEHRYIQPLGTRRLIEQANATGLVGVDLDKPSFGQRHHMLAGDAARGEAERLGDLGEAGRLALLRDALANEGQDGDAAGSQVCHGVHLYSCGKFLTITVSLLIATYL
ncbi:hypothetical protein PFLmoz3_00557 [Pseudomonas fluorescens]|uniref:Uncharacterized protein n=1 Tax=Pseudomonas fluorescens TaxID=294 RepID=A0A109LKZ9_PSEFL|nr:hypothetical protein PFLmoz3_00557 [Pseudomonas fluorescens]